MSQPHRLQTGGDIDRSRTLSFRFNERRYEGHPGDTLASALLANGVHLVARSFKYHRPRGIMTAGVEEPNAMVQVGEGGRTVPNVKATELGLYDGLVAKSVNVFPSVQFDVGAAIGGLSRFMPAGFYYKTFFVSRVLWQRVFEPVIRHAGGWGKAPTEPDPDTYDRNWHHCDILIVGAGPSGLMAALTATTTGARVTLIDENPPVGARTTGDNPTPNNHPVGAALGHEREKASQPRWISKAKEELAKIENLTYVPSTTVFGYYDNNTLTAIEKLAEPGEHTTTTRERLWHLRAKHVILATGAHERPLIFANNDRPGIMLAGAVSTYINRYAVQPGRRAVLFANNDQAYETALALHAAGSEIAVIVDPRSNPSSGIIDVVRAKDIPIMSGHVVVDTRGRKRIAAVAIAKLSASGKEVSRPEWLTCDLLAVSGGWSPVVHLHSQSQGKLDYDETLACFRPKPPVGARNTGDHPASSKISIGAANGTFDLKSALTEAQTAASNAAKACGFNTGDLTELPAINEPRTSRPFPLWLVPSPTGTRNKHFVDLQNDTTAADIALAVQEGFESVEHVKRYTLTGFGTDQGKTSNINALAILAETLGEPIPRVGTTTFRPPYTPVTFAAMGGRDRGELFDPARLTSIHDRHLAAGAMFEDVGQWKRPWYFPRAGEDMHGAVARECIAVRERVGVIDASTLGKIDIQGPDAAEFLNRIYTNNWLQLRVGKVRYGIMCREDGMVFDDGTTARIEENRYLMTTTTGNAAAVLDHLEEYLQTEWPDLRVRLTSVTEQWVTVGVAGPLSARVLEMLAPETDFSPGAFPFMSWQDVTIGGIDARIFRISFTGELQYEINVPWQYGASLWDAVMAAGSEFDIAPYGTETMHVLRAEKGFIIVGQETDGTQTPHDLGLDWAVSDKKDFIGCRSLKRADCKRSDRRQLVGLIPEDRDAAIPEGTQLLAVGKSNDPPPVPMEGFVTSSYVSPTLADRFCLALVRGGRQRYGEVIEAAVKYRKDRPVRMTIRDPVMYDKEGVRRDGG